MGASLDFKISLRSILEAELFLHFHALKKVRGSGSGASQGGVGFYILGTEPGVGGGAKLDHSERSRQGGLLHIGDGARALNPSLPVALPSSFALYSV